MGIFLISNALYQEFPIQIFSYLLQAAPEGRVLSPAGSLFTILKFRLKLKVKFQNGKSDPAGIRTSDRSIKCPAR